MKSPTLIGTLVLSLASSVVIAQPATAPTGFGHVSTSTGALTAVVRGPLFVAGRDHHEWLLVSPVRPDTRVPATATTAIDLTSVSGSTLTVSGSSTTAPHADARRSWTPGQFVQSVLRPGQQPKIRLKTARPPSRGDAQVIRGSRPRHRAALSKCKGLWHLPRLEKRPFRVGEELGYELSVAGAYIGRFETKVGAPRRVNGQRVLPLFGRARTSGFAASFRPFVGRYMAMAEPESLAPVGVRVEATYDKDRRWERVRFDDDGRAVRADFTLHGRQLRRDYNSNHEMTDLLSMLYLARQIEVRQGLAACQHVFGARRLWKMTARVEGSDRLATPAGRMDAWRVKVTFDRMPTPGLNNNKRPHYDMDVYIAKDGSRTPLAFVVEYKGLTARGDLRRWSLSGKSRDDAWTF